MLALGGIRVGEDFAHQAVFVVISRCRRPGKENHRADENKRSNAQRNPLRGAPFAGTACRSCLLADRFRMLHYFLRSNWGFFVGLLFKGDTCGVLLRIERFVELDHALVAVCLQNRHAFEQRFFARGVDGGAECGRRFQFVRAETLHRFRRINAGYCTVDGCAERVHVRPGPLHAARAILFFRRVTGLEHDGETAVAAVGIVPRRAEVEQLDVAFLGDHDVVRADVAVDDARAVHFRKRAHERLHHIEHGCGGELSARVREHLLERFTLDELHYDIRGVVLKEEVLDCHDTRQAVELGEALCFVHKAVASRGKERGFVSKIRQDGGGSVVFARDKAHGVIFFNGNLDAEI
ncbi:hypothetical protein SDC9_117176 [bioreactor metagenome]|uniref:Uncharacterized protein n=1 Tax=bioreactor metagenome TaxID=1076179 RepID=A0A645C4E5_9ZZZZ